MNEESKSDTNDAHQTLKYTKAKMREVLAQIAANQEEHRLPPDTKVSIV